MSKKSNEYGGPNELPDDWSIIEDVERIAQLQFELGEKYQQELRELNELSIQKQALQNANLPSNSKTYRDAKREVDQIDKQMEQRYTKLENKSPKFADKPKVKIPDIISRVVESRPTIKTKDKVTRSKEKSESVAKWLYGAVGSALLIWGGHSVYSSFNNQRTISLEQLDNIERSQWSTIDGSKIPKDVYIKMIKGEKIVQTYFSKVGDEDWTRHENAIRDLKYVFEKGNKNLEIEAVNQEILKLENEYQLWMFYHEATSDTPQSIQRSPRVRLRDGNRTSFYTEEEKKEWQLRIKEAADLRAKFKRYNGFDYNPANHKESP